MPTIATTLTILVNAAWAGRTTWSRTRTVDGPPMPGCTSSPSGPARDRPGAAVGRHLASRLVPRDPRVANVKVLGGVFNRPLMQGVPQIVAAVLEPIKDMRARRAVRALPPGGGVMSQMPPRDTTRLNTSLDSVHASVRWAAPTA